VAVFRSHKQHELFGRDQGRVHHAGAGTASELQYRNHRVERSGVYNRHVRRHILRQLPVGGSVNRSLALTALLLAASLASKLARAPAAAAHPASQPSPATAHSSAIPPRPAQLPPPLPRRLPILSGATPRASQRLRDTLTHPRFSPSPRPPSPASTPPSRGRRRQTDYRLPGQPIF